jgi:hypothetical protein
MLARRRVSVAETVYVFGAGINRNVRDLGGAKPPLATDLFKQVLWHEELGDLAIREIPELFEYIKRYWKRSIEDLREEPFDLEACYTLLQQQRQEFKAEGNLKREEEVARVEDQLTALFTKFLGFIEVSAGDSALSRVAAKILGDRAVVLTFNYDTIVERAMEFVGGRTEQPSPLEKGRVPDEHLWYSDFQWNRALAYGVRFDEVHLQQVGAEPEPVEGERFYAAPENALYPAPILKLHGSLNWFRHTSRRTSPDPYGRSENPKEGKVVFSSGYPHIRSSFGPWEDSEDWILEPVIVTPVLYKDLGGRGPVSESWRRAREELTNCRRLVVAGYSFPPTDFAMHRLFLEAFADGPPDELICVNPNRGMAGRVASLCDFRGRTLVREDLQEFLDRSED